MTAVVVRLERMVVVLLLIAAIASVALMVAAGTVREGTEVAPSAFQHRTTHGIS